MSRPRSRRRKYQQEPAPQSITKGLSAVGALRAGLGGSPGAWASDHRKEAEQYQGWNYVAIKAISQQCGGAECQVFEETDEPGPLRKSQSRKVPDNFRPLPNSHKLVRLLKRPNPNESGSTFLKKIAIQIQLTGTAYIVKLRHGPGWPTKEMYVVPTGWVSAAMPTAEYPRGAYRIDDFRTSQNADGFAEMGNYWALAGSIIKPEDMIVIREPHPVEPCDGQSPVSAGALWSDTSKQIDQARWSHMKNGVNPSLAITPGKDADPSPEEVDRALAKINAGYAGSANAGKVIITPSGATVTPLSQTAEEMDYQGGFEQLRNSTLALHGVPGSAAGITDGGSYAAFYANLLQFITLTVQPLLNMIADELARQLPEYGDNIVIWLTAASVNDPENLRQLANILITAKAIRKNELRELLELGMPEDAEGDEWVGDPPPPPPQPGMMPGAPQIGQQTEAPDEESTGLAGIPSLGKSAPKTVNPTCFVIRHEGQPDPQQAIAKSETIERERMAIERQQIAARERDGAFLETIGVAIKSLGRPIQVQNNLPQARIEVAAPIVKIDQPSPAQVTVVNNVEPTPIQVDVAAPTVNVSPKVSVAATMPKGAVVVNNPPAKPTRKTVTMIDADGESTTATVTED